MKAINLDEILFEELYEAYWQALYINCYQYVFDSDLAKEIVQDVFISLWANRKDLCIHTSFENYLHGALKRKVFEYFRKKKVRDRYLQDLERQPENAQRGVETDFFYKELSSAYQLAIEELPTRCQEVFKLSRMTGLSNKRIALSLAISEKAVEKNISKALGSIRAKLKKYKDA